MLFAQKEERSRQFALALRAGLPLLLFISILFYATFYQDETITINLKHVSLILAVTLVTIYFIYFFISLSVKESLIDTESQRFNTHAFEKQLKKKNIKTLGLLKINNIDTLNKHYSPSQIENIIYTLTQKLDLILKQNGMKNVPIGKHHLSEFLVAVKEPIESLDKVLKKLLLDTSTINNIELDLGFAVIHSNINDFTQIIRQLQDMIETEKIYGNDIQITQKIDAKKLEKIEDAVIYAIKKESLELTFKPLSHTQSKRIDIYEISIKLTVNGEKILPKVFLPIINRLGLGQTYDYLIIAHVITLLQLIDKQISFSFNISPFSLRDKDFQQKVFHHIQTQDIDPSRLIIQLYERKAHHNLSGYLKTLEEFRDQGLRICIDNFGSSNASMQYMQNFKFDIIQFDKDYVTKLNNITSYTMLNSHILMAKELNILTIAKWVDNDEQKEKLSALGIDYLQGFGIGKPITKEQLLKLNN